MIALKARPHCTPSEVVANDEVWLCPEEGAVAEAGAVLTSSFGCRGRSSGPAFTALLACSLSHQCWSCSPLLHRKVCVDPLLAQELVLELLLLQ